MGNPNYRNFHSVFFESICWNNKIVCDYENEFESIKNEMIEIAKNNRVHSTGYSIVRKYNRRKLTIYFDYRFIIKNNKEQLKVKITAIYYRGKRLYEDYVINTEWEI